MRRDFRLPEDDEDHLDSLGLSWEAVESGGERWLLIHEHPIPTGYNVPAATAAIRIDGGYPPGKLDMVWFHPDLARTDGKPIGALSSQMIDGRNFQRWSRHYDWRDGVDSLVSHHLKVEHWLRDELTKR